MNQQLACHVSQNKMKGVGITMRRMRNFGMGIKSRKLAQRKSESFTSKETLLRLFRLFLRGFVEKRSVFHVNRKATYLFKQMKLLSETDLLLLLEEMYQCSKEKKRYELLLSILDIVAKGLDLSADKQFYLWNYYAAAQYDQRLYQEAYYSSLEALKYGQNVSPLDNTTALMLHGEICLQVKKHQEALFAFRKGYHSLPDTANEQALRCKMKIGRIYSKLYQYDQARLFWEKVLYHPQADVETKLMVLIDYTFMELTIGNYSKGRSLFERTERELSNLFLQGKQLSSVEALLHERNAALLLIPENPVSGLKRILQIGERMVAYQLKDDIFETVFLIILFVTKYGNIFNEREIKMLESLKFHI